MSTHFLPIFQENAAYEIAGLLRFARPGKGPLKAFLKIGGLYRIQGLCALFMEGRPENCLVALHKSGRAFLAWLEAAPDSQKITSKAACFFDALSAHDLAAARDIARHARLSWNRHEEYEEDFLYVLFLLKHFFLEAAPDECETILSRYEALLNGEEDPRYDICRAFAQDDAKLFEEGLELLLENHENLFGKLVSAGSIPPEKAETEGNVCVEGLALVNLAHMKGFPLEEDYLFIPSVLRERVAIPFSEDGWKTP